MATRATIKIEGVKYAKVYKYYDGYPSATLEWLKDFNKKFTENRGEDGAYKLAQLLRNSAFDGVRYDLDKSEFTGWGVIAYNDSCGEEYEYTLKIDGTVTYKTI